MKQITLNKLQGMTADHPLVNAQKTITIKADYFFLLPLIWLDFTLWFLQNMVKIKGI